MFGIQIALAVFLLTSNIETAIILLVVSTGKQDKDADIGAGRCPLWERQSDGRRFAVVLTAQLESGFPNKNPNALAFGVRQLTCW